MNARYFPTGAIIVRPKGLDNVEIGLYGGDEFGRCNAIGYHGRSAKPSFRYRFRTQAERDNYIQKFVADCKTRIEMKAERKANTILVSNPVKVGDIFLSSWGYEQTNADFYQVREVKGSFVWIQRIASQMVEGGSASGMSSNVVAVKDAFIEGREVLRKRVTTWDGGKSISLKIKSCAHAYPWDGQPTYSSWYA